MIKPVSVALALCAFILAQKWAGSSSKYDFRDTEDVGEELQFCSENECGELRFENIPKLYRRLFMTEKEITDRFKKKEIMGFNETDSSDVLPGDGDACCVTEVAYTMNDTLVDVLGKERRVVHFPPKYQYVPHITCSAMGCSGRCVIEPMHFNLLVYEGEGTSEDDISFEWFSLPGYCSCKNIS